MQRNPGAEPGREPRGRSSAAASAAAACVNATVDALKNFLRVDTNHKGGTALYKDSLTLVKSRLGQLERVGDPTLVEKLRRHLAEMERNFESKYLKSYKPFLVCMLKLLGISETVGLSLAGKQITSDLVARAESLLEEGPKKTSEQWLLASERARDKARRSGDPLAIGDKPKSEATEDGKRAVKTGTKGEAKKEAKISVAYEAPPLSGSGARSTTPASAIFALENDRTAPDEPAPKRKNTATPLSGSGARATTPAAAVAVSAPENDRAAPTEPTPKRQNTVTKAAESERDCSNPAGGVGQKHSVVAMLTNGGERPKRSVAAMLMGSGAASSSTGPSPQPPTSGSASSSTASTSWHQQQPTPAATTTTTTASAADPIAQPSAGVEPAPAKKRRAPNKAKPPRQPQPSDPPAGPPPPPSAPVSASASDNADMSEYYAVLGISAGASPKEVQAGYRRSVLRAHPDKGGNAEDFRKVVQAFEVLQAYEILSSADSAGVARPPAATQPSGSHGEVPEELEATLAARIALVSAILVVQPSAWPGLLSGLSSHALDALVPLTEELTSVAPVTRKRDAVALQGGAAGTSPKGITGAPGRYAVKVSWRNFSVKSGKPISTLDQAVNLHIALVRMRTAALLRQQDHEAHLEAITSKQPGRAPVYEDQIPVLVHSELIEAVLEEPVISLQFASDIGGACAGNKKGGVRRIMSPFTASLDVSLHHRALIRRAQMNDDRQQVLNSGIGGLTPVVEEVKRIMKETSQRDLVDRAELDRKFVAAVADEAATRKSNASPMLFTPQPPPQLALADVQELAIVQREALQMVRTSAEADRAETDRLRDDVRRATEMQLSLQEDLRREREDSRRVTADASRAKEEAQLRQLADENNKAEIERLKQDLQRERDDNTARRAECEKATQAKDDAEGRFARIQEQLLDVGDAPRRAASLEKENEQLQKECLKLQALRDEAYKRSAGGGPQVRVATPATSLISTTPFQEVERAAVREIEGRREQSGILKHSRGPAVVDHARSIMRSMTR